MDTLCFVTGYALHKTVLNSVVRQQWSIVDLAQVGCKPKTRHDHMLSLKTHTHKLAGHDSFDEMTWLAAI